MLALALFLPLHILDVRFQLIPRIWIRQQRLFWRQSQWRSVEFWRSMRHTWFFVAYLVSFPPSVGNPARVATHLISLLLAIALTAVIVLLERYSIRRGDIKVE